MRVAAAISQPLRAAYCHVYLRDLALSTPPVILTTDPTAFTDLDLPEDTTVLSVTPPLEMLPTGRLVANPLASRFAKWARGRRVERLARSLLWKLRYLDRLALLRRTWRRRPLGSEEIIDSPILAALETLHTESPISQVVVFDLFDLPASLRFAHRHRVDVVVR